MFKFLNRKNLILRAFVIIVTILVTVSVMPVDANDNAAQEAISQNEQLIDRDEGTEDDESTVTESAIEESNDSDGSEEQETEDDPISHNDSISDQTVSSPAITESEVSQKAITPKATEISGTAIIVENFSELKNYLEGNNSYREFYFGADITMTSGITIHSSKNNVLISGKNPETGNSYKYTDMNRADIAYTIRVSGSTKITMKDMEIDGYNYYGPVSSSAASANTGVYITYDNVEYNGPKLCYAPSSTLHIKNSNIVIPAGQKGISLNMEICEVGNLVLEGIVNLNKLSGEPIYSTFWMHSTYGIPEIKIVSGSNVNINSIGYMVYCPGTTRNTNLNIEAGASLNCIMGGGMTYTDHRLGTLTVAENANLKYYHTGSRGASRTALLQGNMSVGNGATLDIRRSQNSYQASPNTRMLISLESSSSEINFNNPARVILVNGLTTNPEGLIRFSNGGKLNIHTKAMNLWETLPSGFLSNLEWSDPLNGWNSGELPLKVWNQYGFEPIQLTATYTSSNPVNTQTLNVSGGYLPATLKNTAALTSSSFLGSSSKVFTLGNTNLDFNNVYTNSNSISGGSAMSSYVGVDFENENGIQSDSAMVNDSGAFSFFTNGRLIGSSQVAGFTQKNFLRGYNYTTVKEDAGYLRFYEVPSTLDFYSGYMPAGAAIIQRERADWNIKIEDTRENTDTWEVYASIDSPLSTEHNGTQYTLPNALIYKVDSNTSVFGSDPILIHSGRTDSSSENGISTIGWDNDRGPLINIQEGDDLLSRTNYTTTITWTLVDGPQ